MKPIQTHSNPVKTSKNQFLPSFFFKFILPIFFLSSISGPRANRMGLPSFLCLPSFRDQKAKSNGSETQLPGSFFKINFLFTEFSMPPSDELVWRSVELLRRVEIYYFFFFGVPAHQQLGQGCCVDAAIRCKRREINAMNYSSSVSFTALFFCVCVLFRFHRVVFFDDQQKRTHKPKKTAAVVPSFFTYRVIFLFNYRRWMKRPDLTGQGARWKWKRKQKKNATRTKQRNTHTHTKKKNQS